MSNECDRVMSAVNELIHRLAAAIEARNYYVAITVRALLRRALSAAEQLLDTGTPDGEEERRGHFVTAQAVDVRWGDAIHALAPELPSDRVRVLREIEKYLLSAKPVVVQMLKAFPFLGGSVVRRPEAGSSNSAEVFSAV